jgi:hypothetical protein
VVRGEDREYSGGHCSHYTIPLAGCGPTGMFAYEIDIGTGRAAHSYDIIRHAGVMYALATLNRYHPNRRAAETLSRAGTFLRTAYIGPDSRSGGLAVWSRPLPAKSVADPPFEGSKTIEDRVAEDDLFEVALYLFSQ